MFLRMMDIFILNAYLSWQNDCILQNYCFRQVVDSRNRTHISNDHEYILAYSQNIDLASLLDPIPMGSKNLSLTKGTVYCSRE